MISSIYRGWRFARDLKEAYGVSAFLEKPFQLDELWSTVERTWAETRRKRMDTRRLPAEAKKAVAEGIKLFKANDLDGAIERFRAGIQIDPLSAKLHYQLATLLLRKKGMVFQAMQQFEEAVTLDPEMLSALRNLAILYQSKGFKNKAVEMWERALRSTPDQENREQIRRHLARLI
jgi:tetratricopeptide (TPR) repeat protein